MIVDVHAHVFPAVRGRIAGGAVIDAGYGQVSVGSRSIRWLPPWTEQTIFTPEMLIAHMDWACVDRSVLLQGPFSGDCNQYVRQAVELYPGRLSGCAQLDPWEPNCRSAFDDMFAEPGFVGLKLECSEATGLIGLHPSARLDDPSIAWLWRELEERALVLVLDLGAVGSRSYQTAAVRQIATEHPELRIVVAHLAQPTPAAEADKELWALWLDQIDLGRLPNVFFDLAALPAYLPGEEFPFPSAGRYLRMAIDRVGPAKLMFGSDAPGLLVHASYPQLVALTRRHIGFLAQPEQAMILAANAISVFAPPEP